MNRRTCLVGLGGIATAGLAGCLGGGGGDSDGGDGDNGSSGSGLALVEHDFNRPEGSDSPEFAATVENNTNETQTVNVQLTLNTGGASDDASFTVNLEPGEMGSGSALLIDLESPDDVTGYVIALSEGLFSDPTVEREFSGDEFRERLNS